LGEALSTHNYAKIEWCQEYIQKIRTIQMEKWENISSDIFMYIEKYTEQTEEERQAAMKNNPGRKLEGNQKAEFTLKHTSEDISFGMWANVAAKMQTIRKVEFDYFKSALPHQQKSAQLIMRNSWTSFDYISGPENLKKFDYICVGGVILNRLFFYPEPPRGMM
jgi:hypothetical protein